MTIFIVITGIIYALLLSKADVGIDNDWTNDALHRVIPLIMLTDWVAQPARPAVRALQALVSLLFPFLYGVYTLIRGPIVGWYLYPFIDPRPAGYFSMALGLVVVLAGLVGIALSVNVAGAGASRRAQEDTGSFRGSTQRAAHWIGWLTRWPHRSGCPGNGFQHQVLLAGWEPSATLMAP